jgi:hypothetical protein
VPHDSAGDVVPELGQLDGGEQLLLLAEGPLEVEEEVGARTQDLVVVADGLVRAAPLQILQHGSQGDAARVVLAASLGQQLLSVDASEQRVQGDPERVA